MGSVYFSSCANLASFLASSTSEYVSSSSADELPGLALKNSSAFELFLDDLSLLSSSDEAYLLWVDVPDMAQHSIACFLSVAFGWLLDHFKDNSDPPVLVIPHMKVRLIDGNCCAQGLVQLQKTHSPNTDHTYSSQLLDGIKSEQQIEPQQFLVHNQNLNMDRMPAAHVKLNKSYPRALKGPFTNSEPIHFFPLPRLTNSSDYE